MSRHDQRAPRAGTLAELVRASWPELSATQVQQQIAAGQIFVDGQRGLDPNVRVPAGARLRRYDQAPAAPPPLPILYEDEELLILDKPAGIHLNATETTARLAAVEALPGRELYLVHRIDVGTTGLVALAKTAEVAQRLSSAFRERTVQKEYWAVAVGKVSETSVSAPIGPDKRRPRARMVRPDGKPAFTELEARSTLDGLTAVVARPHTGRTHQIRLHLFHLGAPLLGDTLYGGPTAHRVAKVVIRPGRPLLHARGLRFELRGREHRYISELPEDFRELVGLGLDFGPG